jgi:hypothetical protein
MVHFSFDHLAYLLVCLLTLCHAVTFVTIQILRSIYEIRAEIEKLRR